MLFVIRQQFVLTAKSDSSISHATVYNEYTIFILYYASNKIKFATIIELSV